MLDSESSEFNLVQRSEPSDSICCKVEDRSCSPTSEEILKTVTLNEANGEAIDTFVVGRKFSDVQDLKIGGNIFLLRQPENVKDSKAIKVSFLSFIALSVNCILNCWLLKTFYLSFHTRFFLQTLKCLGIYLKIFPSTCPR